MAIFNGELLVYQRVHANINLQSQKRNIVDNTEKVLTFWSIMLVNLQSVMFGGL